MLDLCAVSCSTQTCSISGFSGCTLSDVKYLWSLHVTVWCIAVTWELRNWGKSLNFKSEMAGLGWTSFALAAFLHNWPVCFLHCCWTFGWWLVIASRSIIWCVKLRLIFLIGVSLLISAMHLSAAWHSLNKVRYFSATFAVSCQFYCPETPGISNKLPAFPLPLLFQPTFKYVSPFLQHNLFSITLPPWLPWFHHISDMPGSVSLSANQVYQGVSSTYSWDIELGHAKVIRIT